MVRERYRFARSRRVLDQENPSMHVDDIADRISLARADELDHIVRDMWTDHTHGLLTEGDMEALDEAARARRAEARPKPRAAPPSAPRAPARRPPQSPDRQASIERRRRLAASGPMPPALAARFSTAEIACLCIIAGQVTEHGVCSLPIGAICAMAGCQRTTAKNAIRLGRLLGLLQVTERRRRGQNSETNLIHIISAEWLTWLRIGTGVKRSTTTNTSDSFPRSHTVPGYRSKRLGKGGYRLAAREKGGPR
jgi:hypothetical protein